MATSFSRLIQFLLMSALVVIFQRTKGTSRTGLCALLFSDAEQEGGMGGHAFENGEGKTARLQHHHLVPMSNGFKDTGGTHQPGQDAQSSLMSMDSESSRAGATRGRSYSGDQEGLLDQVGRLLVQGSQPSLLWTYLKLGIPGTLPACSAGFSCHDLQVSH